MTPGAALEFRYTVVYVADVIAAIGWWQQAFGITVRFAHPSRRYTDRDTGTVTSAKDGLAARVLGELGAGYTHNRPSSPPALAGRRP